MTCDPAWEHLCSTQGWGKYPSEPVIRWVMRTLGRHPDRSRLRVLDLGCGPGANTWFLAREGFAVAAMDGSPTAIAQNRELLRQEGLDAELHVGDITAVLPWPDATFDFVLDNVAIYANPMPAIRRGLAEVARVLKPGGTFLHLSFTDRCWGYGEGEEAGEPGAYHKVAAGPLAKCGYVQFLGRTDLDRLLAGFTDHQIERNSYTLENGARLIEQWVVVCRKTGDRT